MKRFKDIINEFRIVEPPSGRSGRGESDPIGEVLDFMKNVPFEHKTADEHTLHFYDSHDAANRLMENREKHDRGWGHAIHAMSKQKEISDGNFLYFASSVGSHDDALQELFTHIHNHPQLPAHLREWIPAAFDRMKGAAVRRIDSLQNAASITSPMGQSSDIGEITFRKHAHSSTGDHPHENDTSHHFQTIIKQMKEDPDVGFFLHSSEMA